ncbi:hypothetical protein J4226_01785 [Candidatus Pacearchaeota archaeon]|nr:hypothetical protein [Candidatus Pacearchaeota archaeon]
MGFGIWFSENWGIAISLLLSIVAISFTALKDFIIPYWFKPKLKISYLNSPPYERQTVLTGSNFFMFHRFKIENIGKSVARNCRCQIYQIENEKKVDRDLQGFPLKWATFPDMHGDFEKPERINIGSGESEFVDLFYFGGRDQTKFQLSSYDNSVLERRDGLKLGNYVLHVIISGDNFKPYIAKFKIEKTHKNYGLGVKLLEVVKR